MGGLENAPIPDAWRGIRNNPLGRFTIQHIPGLAEHIQTDT